MNLHSLIRNKLQKLLANFFALLLFSGASEYASAEIVDNITLKTDVSNNEVDAVIKFTVPIQYIRHFPQEKSSYLEIDFNILDNVSRSLWIDYASHRSPPSDLIYSFTVTTRDLKSGPKVEIQFVRPVEFSVTAGSDNMSLLVHIKPIDSLRATEKIVTPLRLALPIPPLPATPSIPSNKMVQAPLIAATPALPTPKIELPVTPPQAIPFTAPANVIKHAIKDDLPIFPEIAPPTSQSGAGIQPENTSPENKIKLINNASGMLMIKAREALFSGQLFTAIEILNNVLKLPPNRYSQDAQVWIGIAREKSGQLAKAKIEYNSYLQLYPEGSSSAWVKERLSKLNAVHTPSQMTIAAPTESDSFKTKEYGSFSMYYYHGTSSIDTMSTMGSAQTSSSTTITDQSSLISNMSMTAQAYNNEYDDRIVFQDYYSKSFLPGQGSRNRLNSAFLEIKNRIENYSARIGRQSAAGSGVMGRFDGISLGQGFLSDWRANLVAGQLSDALPDTQPVFLGGSLDFGIKSPVGGSLYTIRQTVGGVVDRNAVGGYLRYFDQRKTAMFMLDYDIQFRELNMATMQASLNGESGTDFNFLLDTRKTPSLSIRNATNGSTASINTLLQNSWTNDDLLALAKLRTAVSNMAQIGMTNHINKIWQTGTDITVTNTSGMPDSGTLNPDGTTGLEGFVPASASTGNAWTISQRLVGDGVFSDTDVSMCSLSYSKNDFMEGKTLLLNSHSYIQEQWIIDETLRVYWQTDSTGGKQTLAAPVLRVSYQLRRDFTIETEAGVDLTKSSGSTLASSSTARQYASAGFRWDF